MEKLKKMSLKLFKLGLLASIMYYLIIFSKGEEFQKNNKTLIKQHEINKKEVSRSLFKKIKLKTFLHITSDLDTKNELLSEFLSLKTNENSDKITMMTIKELRLTFQDSFTIIKYDANLLNKTNNIKFGSQSCNLETIAQIDLSVPVCPWHWEIIQREDKYPFKRPIVRCNCDNCQAKTIFDSDNFRLSFCRPEFLLLPVLIKTSAENKTEKWSFGLEEIPFSCVCAIKINPQN